MPILSSSDCKHASAPRREDPPPRRHGCRLPQQGDSELDGTGVETSVNGKFKLTLHKKADLPPSLKVTAALYGKSADFFQDNGDRQVDA